MANPQKLSLSLFGGTTLRLGGRRIALASRKAEALLGYLALSMKQIETRERIVGLLWSETEESKARASLRQVLAILRASFRDLGFTCLTTERTEVGLDLDAIDLDVKSVLESVASGRPADVLLEQVRLTDSLLAGYDDIDPSFRSWIAVQRESLRQKLTRGLEDQLASVPPDRAQGRRIAEALIQLDATHEGAYQVLIQSYVDAGDVAGALAAYKKLWDLLDEEYDMEPSEKTQALITAIKSGTYRSQPTASREISQPAYAETAAPVLDRSAIPTKLALVIEPFDLAGMQATQRHVGVGFRYELIARLVRFREWSLVDGALDLPASREATGKHPHYTISANFLQDGERTSVFVMLKADDGGTVVWSDRYELDPRAFFVTQHDLIRNLAIALNVHLSVERLSRIAGAPDISLDVFDRWLRGQYLLLSWNPLDRSRATELFESITKDAPSFAPAYSGLVQMVNTRHTALPGLYRTQETLARAISLAKTAVHLDPLDSRAHLCFAWAHAMNGQHGLAEIHFGHACDLNEYDPWTRTSAALGFACCDQLDRARVALAKALELSPLGSPLGWSYITLIRFLDEDYEGSIMAAERAGDAFRYVPGFNVASLALLGRSSEAHEEAKRFLQLIHGSWFGDAPPCDESIVRWLLEFLPIRSKIARERLAEGFALAGFPIAKQ